MSSTNKITGKGSDRRRKDKMNSRLRDENLFRSWDRELTRRFNELVGKLETETKEAALEHLQVIQGTLDIIRTENRASEGEADPEFQRRVAEEVASARRELARVQEAIA